MTRYIHLLAQVHLELQYTGCCQAIRDNRSTGARGQVRGAQAVGCSRIGRHVRLGFNRCIDNHEMMLCLRSDYLHVRRHCTVMNYNTMEKVKRFEAHSDYIRSIAVHPSLSILLTSSDDMLVRRIHHDEKHYFATIH